MFVKPNQSFSTTFTTQTPSTGAATNADSTPTAVAYKNGTVDAGFVLTVATTGTTGHYKVTGTVPVGYAAGDMFDVMVTAIMATVTGRQSIGTWQVDTKRNSDLQDVAATAIVSAGAITTSGGKVSGVILVDTLTTYTGNTLQTGDSFARLGLAGAGLTALGDTRIAAIKAKTDALPAAPAAVGDIPTASQIRVEMDSNSTRLSTIAGYLDTEIAAIKAQTDLIPAAPAAIGDIPTAVQIRTEMDSNSTRLTAIKAKTDALPAAPAAVGDIPTDYQQRDVAVTLPDPAPDGYGGSGGGGSLTEEQAEQLTTIATQTALISTGSLEVISPVSTTGQVIEIVAGDDYHLADNRALLFAHADWPVLTGGTVVFKLAGLDDIPATLNGTRSCYVEIDGTDTAGEVGGKRHELQATLSNGHVVTLVRGQTNIAKEL